jgi:hypothetical protein
MGKDEDVAFDARGVALEGQGLVLEPSVILDLIHGAAGQGPEDALGQGSRPDLAFDVEVPRRRDVLVVRRIPCDSCPILDEYLQWTFLLLPLRKIDALRFVTPDAESDHFFLCYLPIPLWIKKPAAVAPD